MKIMYRNQNDKIAILTPSPRCLATHTIESIALKDVLEGLPFWIVPDDFIPTDRTFRDAWELPDDIGEPSGYGSTHTSFKEIEDAESE